MKKKNHQTEADSNQDWVPLHLQGAVVFAAQDVVAQFARDNGGRHVLFVDDRDKCKRSIRSFADIFVNTRATFWDGMIQPPWLCQSPAEAIVQRFLHEVGHIVDQSPGDPSLVSTSSGLIFANPNGLWGALLDPREKAAWDFAFTTRDRSQSIYRQLLRAVEVWYASHQYQGKDWDDSSQDQWRRIMGQELPADPWIIIPEEIRRAYQPR